MDLFEIGETTMFMLLFLPLVLLLLLLLLLVYMLLFLLLYRSGEGSRARYVTLTVVSERRRKPETLRVVGVAVAVVLE